MALENTLNSNLGDIKGEPIDTEVFVHTGILDNKTRDHIKAECINECDSYIKVEENSSDTEELNVKNYSCQHCEKTYSLRKSLVNHMSIHTGVKNHSCNQCSKKFSRKDILLQHLKTHTFKPTY